jgi:diacylglycerol kinase (ATP)
LDRSVLILNPRAGGLVGRGRVAALLRQARQLGAEVVESNSVPELLAAVGAAVAARADRVVVAGGDGTLHRAIQLLAGTRSALGVVPAGRGNDLARILGVSLDPPRALRHALSGPIQRIDLGRVGDRWFACVGGLGLVEDVADAARRAGKAVPGPFVYPWALLLKLPGFTPPRLRIECAGGVWEGRTMLALFANGSTFGGGMRVAPRARLDDGQLDVVIVGDVGKLELLRVFPRVYRGDHVDHPAVMLARAPVATVVADRPFVPWGDGEPLAETPATEVTFGVAEGALLVVAQPEMSSKSVLER